MNKLFIIVLVLSIIIGYAAGWKVGVLLFSIYAVLRIIYNFLK